MLRALVTEEYLTRKFWNNELSLEQKFVLLFRWRKQLENSNKAQLFLTRNEAFELDKS